MCIGYGQTQDYKCCTHNCQACKLKTRMYSHLMQSMFQLTKKKAYLKVQNVSLCLSGTTCVLVSVSVRYNMCP